jgi:hypothetical protein
MSACLALIKLLVASASVLSLGFSGYIQPRSLGVQVQQPTPSEQAQEPTPISQPKVLANPVVLAPMFEPWLPSAHG